MPQHKGGKKNRKFGRNKDKCAAYRAKGTRDKNKARKAASRKARFRAARSNSQN